jgi:6-phosphogluconolactonase
MAARSPGAHAAPRVVRSRDPVRSAGDLVAAALARADERRGAARLAIPGGSALAALSEARAALGPAWSRVRLTWVDERCVAFADPDSNRGAAYRTGALRAEHAPADELPLFLDGELPAAAVARVEAALDRRLGGALDVLLLGMGEDGHVASLFPGGSWFADRRVAHVRASPKPPPERITLTLSVLSTAREAILLASGESKRSALRRLVSGDPSLPATHLRGLTIVTELEPTGPA